MEPEPYESYVIMPFGKNGSKEKIFWDEIYNHIFRPAIIKGYKDAYGESVEVNIWRGDDLVGEADITCKIIHALYSAKFVLADLTGFNANVMWELGVRMTFRGGCLATRLDDTIEEGDNTPDSIISENNAMLPSMIGTMDYTTWSSNSHEMAIATIAGNVRRILLRPKIDRNPIESYLKSQNIYRVLPYYNLFKDHNPIAHCIEEVHNMQHDLFDPPLRNLLHSFQSDPKFFSIKRGIALLEPSLFKKFMIDAYNTASSIRCTSTDDFVGYWKDNKGRRQYGKYLLKCSKLLSDKKNGEICTTRLFLTSEEDIQKNNGTLKKIFKEQEEHGIELKVQTSRKFQEEIGKELWNKLKKEILPVTGLIIDNDEKLVDIMLVDNVCGAVLTLSDDENMNNQSGRLPGIFFHKGTDLGYRAYTAFNTAFNELEGESVHWRSAIN